MSEVRGLAWVGHWTHGLNRCTMRSPYFFVGLVGLEYHCTGGPVGLVLSASSLSEPEKKSRAGRIGPTRLRPKRRGIQTSSGDPSPVGALPVAGDESDRSLRDSHHTQRRSVVFVFFWTPCGESVCSGPSGVKSLRELEQWSRNASLCHCLSSSRVSGFCPYAGRIQILTLVIGSRIAFVELVSYFGPMQV